MGYEATDLYFAANFALAAAVRSMANPRAYLRIASTAMCASYKVRLSPRAGIS